MTTNRPSPRTGSRAIVTAVLLGLATTAAATADVLFVRANQALPTGLQDGSSWATAYKDLQTAIFQALPGDQVWVAQGVYKPTTGTSRSATFLLLSGISVIGGFAGTESAIDERSPFTNPTILSGEIGAAGPADNSFHVVTAINLATLTILDRVTIEAGNANGSGSDAIGPAARIANSNLLLSSCTIRHHTSTGAGAVHISSSLADRRARLFQSLLVGNATGASLVVQGIGGASISQCTIVHNALGVQFNDTPAQPSSLANSIIYFNGNGLENQQYVDTVNHPTIVGCVIQAWDNVSPSAPTTVASDPRFLKALGSDGIVGTNDDDFGLRGDSPAIDRGNTSFIGVADALDLDGDGNTSEIYPIDMDLVTRRIDDPMVPNVGSGAAPHTDAGCHEYARPRTVLVNHAATGANTGKTWTDAYTDLQSALAELAHPELGGAGEIWVAKGTYKPTSGIDSAISFSLSAGVQLFGGFAGGELSRSQRDWTEHTTILSGDIGPAGPAGNSRHVVRCSVSSNPAPRVDGFTIRDGVCPVNEGGGGVRFESGTNALLAYCTITGNSGTGKGAAVHVSGPPGLGGGMVYCAVIGNHATGSGVGGVVMDGYLWTILRSVIAGNTSTAAGGPAGVQSTGMTGDGPMIASTAIFDNRSAGVANFAAQVSNGGTPLQLLHVAAQALFPSTPGITFVNCFSGGSSGGMVDANGGDDIYGTADDNFLPAICSFIIDAAGGTVIVSDSADIDEDGVVFESSPFDYRRGNAFVDLPVPNVVTAAEGTGDIGAVERSFGGGSPDLDGDGTIGGSDLALLLGAWGSVDSPFELTGDCIIDASDLAIVLGAWGA